MKMIEDRKVTGLISISNLIYHYDKDLESSSEKLKSLNWVIPRY